MNLFRMAAYVLKDWPVMPGAVLLGGIGPPTRTPGNGILPGATVTELIDVA